MDDKPTEEDIEFRPARASDAEGITECWYKAFGPYPLNDWILPPPTRTHGSYLAHACRSTRSTILQGESGIYVAHDRSSDRIAGYVTYKEMRDNVALQSPTLLNRLVNFVRRLVLVVRTTVDRVVYGLDFRPIDHRLELIARQQEAVFRAHADIGFPAGKGRRYLYITWLAVHPDYQGRKVGSLLLRHGEASGLPLYLESSHEGHPVYLHKGFRELGPRLEIRREDGSLVESLPTMLYEPKGDSAPR